MSEIKDAVDESKKIIIEAVKLPQSVNSAGVISALTAIWWLLLAILKQLQENKR